MELYAYGIYPKIFTRIDSLFKAGEGTLGFRRKFVESPTCTMIDKRYALLKPLRGKRRTAPRGVSKIAETGKLIFHLIQHSAHLSRKWKQIEEGLHILTWEKTQ